MRHMGLGLGVCVILLASGAAFGELIVTVPSKAIAPGAIGETLTLTIGAVGMDYGVQGYNLQVDLMPQGTASGLTFGTTDMAISGYILPLPPAGFGVAGVTPTTVVAFDGYGPDFGMGHTIIPDGTSKNLFTIDLSVGAVTPGDVFDVVFPTDLDIRQVYEWFGGFNIDVYPQDELTFVPGRIFITPEPATMALLAVGGCLALVRRKRRA